MAYDRLLRGRRSLRDHCYALTFCTASRRALFRDDSAATIVADVFRRADELGYCDGLAYVVMPDHAHWLVALTSDAPLAFLVGATKAHASRRLRSEHAIQMPVWQRGYYDHRVCHDEDLKQQARYLVANAIRGGLVSRWVDYPHWFAVWAPPPHGRGVRDAEPEDLLEH
jgi:putative transposase